LPVPATNAALAGSGNELNPAWRSCVTRLLRTSVTQGKLIDAIRIHPDIEDSIMVRAFLFSAALFIPLGLALAQEADEIKAKLDKAKEAYTQAAERARQDLYDAFDKKEESARSSGNKKLVDQIKAERKAFEESGKLPKIISTTSYKSAMATARAPLDAAYQSAIKEYTKARKDDEATAVEAEWKKFKDGGAVVRTKVMPVNFVGKPLAGWSLKEIRTGNYVFPDRGYKIADVPKELAGGTMLIRNSTESKHWLRPGAVAAGADGDVFVLVRYRWLGNEEIDSESFAKFVAEGWDEVKCTFGTTFPTGEDWQWRVFRKSVKKGDIDLPLETTKLTTAPLIFVFR
jgi:hypothetical protein